MSDVVTLRKLTYKSILGFGKYGDSSIRMLSSTQHGRKYLRWVYYNSSRITFMEDILDDLRILSEYRIGKPGVNPDMHDALKSKFYEEVKDIKGKRKIILDATLNKHIKGRSNTIIYSQFESKRKMQKRNQGHI